MRTFEYQDQGGVHIITDEQIIKEYYPWWSKQMKKANKEHLTNEENCIEDFKVVHYATEITKYAERA